VSCIWRDAAEVWRDTRGSVTWPQRIVLQALREDARERPSAAECLDHPWMRLPTAKQQASGKTAPAFSSSSAEADPLWIWTPGVGTFASPSHSLSPMMATWKIPTQAEGALTFLSLLTDQEAGAVVGA